MDFSQRRRVQPALQPKLATSSASGLVTGRQRDLRKLRHSGLFEAVHRLDAQLDPSARQELAEWIKGQYEQEYGDVPLGLVALCHLGPPYVDHRLDLGHTIVEHYGAAESMSAPFDAARMLVRTGAFDYVEVFGSGQLVSVRADGSVVIS